MAFDVGVGSPDRTTGRGTGAGQVLVVSESEAARAMLAEETRSAGFEVLDVLTLGAVMAEPTPIAADAIVVDLGSFDVTRTVQLLRRNLMGPLMTVAARSDEVMAGALDSGASDHVELPLRSLEFAARLRALIRGGDGQSLAAVRTPDFELDFDARRAARDGSEVHLTPLEWSFVELLVRQEGRVVRQHHLLTSVWGADKSDHVEYLRVCLHTVRRKLEPDPAQPRYFITVPRVGVRFETAVTAELSG
jgi:two-component system KDP operon response regulator KdpE